MATLKIAWTRLALEDLAAARDFIADERPAAAEAVIVRVESALEALSRHPEMGRPGRLAGTKELVVTRTPFVIPYRVRGKRIEILAFIHGARRWPDSL